MPFLEPNSEGLDELHNARSINAPGFEKYATGLAARIDERLKCCSATVMVVDTTLVNAFVRISFGEISLSRGMLNVMRNEAQLVALLGHEYGHQVLHSKREVQERAMRKNVDDLDWITGTLGLNVGGVVGHARRELTDALFAHYDQAHEQEADEFGAEQAAQLGYDPYQFVHFFEELAKLHGEGIAYHLHKFKGSHPKLAARAEKLRRFLKAKGYREGVGKVAEDTYRSHAAPIAYGTGAEREFGTYEDRLAEIESETKTYRQKGTRPSLTRFIEIMSYLSEVNRKFDLKIGEGRREHAALLGPKETQHFLEETIRQGKPLWILASDPRLIRTVKGIVGDLGKMAVGLTPGIGDAIDFYELIAGRDFYTDEELSTGDRMVTAIGILAGSGSQWRRAAKEVTSAIDSTAAISRATRNKTGEVIAKSEKFLSEAEKQLHHDGLRRLSAALRDAKIQREYRKEVVESFAPGTLRWKKYTEDVPAFRWHNDDEHARKFARFLSPDKIADPEVAKTVYSLPATNRLLYLDEYKILKDAGVFVGEVAPKHGLPGGGTQIFIPGDLSKSLRWERSVLAPTDPTKIRLSTNKVGAE